MNADEILNNTDPQELRNLLKRLKIDQKAGMRPPPTIIVNQAPAQYVPPPTSLGNVVEGDLTVHGNVIADNIGRDYFTELVTTNGYSGSHVNPNTYRWNAVTTITLSGTTYQAINYWDKGGYLVIATRVLDGEWTMHQFTDISVTAGDNHHVSAIGIDPNGYIHVCYNMHIDPLHYRRSTAPISSAWNGILTAEISMVGANESQVTYPTFINDPAGTLYFMFRDGGGGNGDLFFYKYNHSTLAWAAATGTGTGGKLLDGKTSSPDESPYWDHPTFDSNFGSGGFLHLSWHWHKSTDLDGSNHDVSYVRWNGTSFTKAAGTAQTVPITPANCEIVDNTSGANLGMTSFNSLDSDGNGKPHIVYPKTSGGYRNLFHAWYNGSAWVISQLTYTNNPNTVSDVANDPIGLTPSIAIDRSTNVVYVFYVDKYDIPGILAMISEPADFTLWTRAAIYPLVPGGWWSPKYDYTEWRRSTVIYFSIEYWDGDLLAGTSNSFPIAIFRWDPAVDGIYSFRSGDMFRSIYDTDQDGVVDNAEELGGHPASDFTLVSDLFDDAEGSPADTTIGSAAYGTSAFAARRDHVHHTEPPSSGGAGQVTGLDRWVSSGGATFDLPDVAEYLLIAADNGSLVDPLTFSLSSDRTQIVFDSAITAGHVVTAEYIIAQV